MERSGPEPAPDALRHPEALLAAAEFAAAMGFWEWDLRTGEHRWSRGLYRLLGLTPGIAPGWEAFLSVVDPADRARVAASARLAGTQATVRSREFTIVRPDARERRVVWRGRILRAVTGAPMSVIATVQDVTEQRRAEHQLVLAAAERARAEQTAQLLTLTDAALSTLSLDELLDELLTRVSEALPARTAALLLLEGGEDSLVLRATHGLPETPAETATIAPGRGLAARVSEQRHAVSMTGPEIAGLRLTALRQMGAVAGAPLLIGTRMIGVLEVGRVDAIPFAADELALLQLAADRIALALDHARAVARERYIAQTLQRSLLPEALPEIEGVEVQARFLPAGEGHEVGGDFYDVTELGDQRWLLVIGDVCGKGPAAAALTAMIRYTIRVEATHEPRPAELLGLLNDAIAAQRSGVSFCTVLCLVVDLGRPRPVVAMASGGHPMPLILRRDGTVEIPPNPGGPIVGVFSGVDFTQVQWELGAGEAVIAFTDGLLEAHAPERILTARELADEVGRRPHSPLDGYLQALEKAALGTSVAPVRDDIAILALAVDAAAVGGDAPEDGGLRLARLD